MIRISSKIHGIEVGGMRHPMQTVCYTEEQIQPEQLDAFLASEFLTVEIDAPAEPADELAEDPADDEATAKPAKGKK